MLFRAFEWTRLDSLADLDRLPGAGCFVVAGLRSLSAMQAMSNACRRRFLRAPIAHTKEHIHVAEHRPHLNFRGQARQALTFYHSIFGGDLTIVTYGDLHAAEDPADTDQVMWGQVAAESGFTLMAYDVQSARAFDRGDRSFYVALRGQREDEVRASWEGLAQEATILTPFAPAPWGPLYGMLTDRFGITWIVEVTTEHAS